MVATSLMQKATRLFLYGQDSVPSSSALVSDQWIRPTSAKSPINLNIDLASYMSSGGGRFATGAKFELVDKFFDTNNVLAQGIYSKSAVISALGGVTNLAWSMSQLDYRDGNDDYAERVYVFNSCSFKIVDDAFFVVNSDGTREIMNYAIEAFVDNANGFPDDFDLVGGGLTALLGNAYLEPAIDPWKIGRTVDIIYTGNVARSTYKASNYAYDVANENPGTSRDIALANAKMDEVIQGLWDAGVTKLIDPDGRPIIYGTDGADTIPAGYANTLTLYQPYYQNGVTLITGKGNDVIIGSAYNDKLYGGAGNDTLTGGTGDDQFIINSGDGNDIIADTTLDVGDRVVYNGGILSGEATNLANGNYKLNGYVLEKQGNDLYITSDGNATGVTVRAFFPAEYDDTQVHTMMGITIPAEKNDDKIDSSINQIPNDTGRVSPIVLDLNGDGLKYIAYNYSYGKNAHFDIDNDGFAEGMEWLNANDGFLVRDTNGNGKIDNQKEMFGDDSGTTAYYKLAQYDTNRDSKVDASDTGFAGLRIWQDLNGNGSTDANELKTLAALNIKSLSLQTSAATTLNGHAIAGTSTFTRTDNTVGNAADVLFYTNQVDSVYVGSDTSVKPTLDLTNLFLPISKGYGTLLPLQYAMTQDAALKTMVTNLSSLNIATQMDEVYDRINAVILQWGGATNIAPTGTSTNQNAAKVAVLQRLVDGSTGFINIDQAYGTLFDNIASKILMQGTLKAVFPLSYYDYENDRLVLVQGYDQIVAQAKSLAPTNQLDKQIYWTEIARIFKTQSDGSIGFQKIFTETGISINFTPKIIGSAGNDILTGFGEQQFQGMAGDDIFNYGFRSSFTYNIGDGVDTLTPNPGSYSDIIINFGLGITYNSLTFTSTSGNLVIGIPGGGAIKISDINNIDRLFFSDGTIKNYIDINYKTFAGIGTYGNDTLYGTLGNDVFYGLGGNDKIYAGPGNDTVYGGDGDDYIVSGTSATIVYGDSGNDFVTSGAGADTINGGSGSDTVAYWDSTSGVNVDLSSSTAQSGGYAQGDILTNIENVIGTHYNDFFVGNSSPNGFNTNGLGSSSSGGAADTVSYINSDVGVTVLLDAGGSRSQISAGYASGDLLNSITNLNGSAFSDILTGNSSDNLINGGDGNDRLNGGSGNDTLTGGSGADIFVVQKNAGSSEIITDFSPTTVGEYINLLGFTNSVAFANLAITQIGPDALITLENSQTITLKNILISSLTAANFSSTAVINGTSGNDFLSGTSLADTINGLAGNDAIIGDLGADIIDGGTNIDTIYYVGSSSSVTVNLALATAQSGGDAAGDILSNIENVTGSAYADTLTALSTGSILDGSGGNDTLIGGIGNDTLIGGVGADTINGGAGIDTVSYASSNQYVHINLLYSPQGWGGDANGDIITNVEIIIGSIYGDALTASNTGNTLDGSDGDDTLNGGIGNDTLLGGNGNDYIYGGAGSDLINGGNGSDTVDYSASTSTVTVNLAIQQVSGGDAQGDTILGIENVKGSNYSNNILTAASTGSKLTGGHGNDNLLGGVGNDIIDGWGGVDTIDGAGGIDTISYRGTSAPVTVNLNFAAQSGGAQGDTLYNIENIIGSSWNDTLIGNDGSNVIEGDGGSDTIDGGGNIDTVSYAGLNYSVAINLASNTVQINDYYKFISTLNSIENAIGSKYNDTIIGSGIANLLDGGVGNDTVTGGAGADIFVINKDAGSSDIITDFSTSTSGEYISLLGFTGSVAFANLAISQSGANTVITLENGQTLTLLNVAANTLTAASFGQSSIINGTAGNDVLVGTSAADIINGLDGNDTITGGLGADTINGGNGSDTVSYSASTTGVTVNLNLATAQSGGEAAGDILSNIENVTGSAFNDSLTASATGSILTGGAGVDTLTGNTGNDTFIGGTGGDIINGGAGIDTVSYADSASLVDVNLTRTTVQFGGSATDDVFSFVSGVSTIENIIGSAYADKLVGNSVANTINGGAGIDSMSYFNSTAAVTVNLSLTTAQSGGFAAGDILSNIENVTGSDFNDSLTASATGSILTGGAGVDTLTGNTGNDTFIGGIGGDIINGAAGVDTVSYADSAGLVDINLTRTTVQFGGSAQDDILSNIENIIGSNFADLLAGNATANNINGGTGIDTMSYATSASAVTVNLATNVNTGGDAAGDVLSSIEIVIGSAFNDNLTALATGSTLTGGAGNDTLNGGNGNDILIGDSGADAMIGGAGIDTVSYAASAVVNVNLSITTAQGWDAAGDTLVSIENLIGSAYGDTLSGSAVDNDISGGAGNDTINSGAGNDIVHGDAGNDTIYGSDGDDIIYGDDGNDIIYGNAGTNILIGGAGADSLNGFTGVSTASYSTSSAAVNINLATSTYSGGDAVGDTLAGINNIIGSLYADTIVGNTSANIISGGAGKDTMTGGTGADVFKYCAVTDSGAASGVRDIITDFSQVQADKIDLSSFAGAFTFKGTSAFTGTGIEVNYAQVSGNTIVGIDADGNGALDFQIELAGLHTLTSSDFLL